ncbi:hypothetical protein D3C80_2029660 [compost metagenome]
MILVDKSLDIGRRIPENRFGIDMGNLIGLIRIFDSRKKHFGRLDSHFIAENMDRSKMGLDNDGLRSVVKAANDNILRNRYIMAL